MCLAKQTAAYHVGTGPTSSLFIEVQKSQDRWRSAKMRARILDGKQSGFCMIRDRHGSVGCVHRKQRGAERSLSDDGHERMR